MVEHQWTTFELQLMLALMVKNVHKTGRPELPTEPGEIVISKTGKRRLITTSTKLSKDPYSRQKQARLDFVSMFNESLNGNLTFSHDISAHEVLYKLDELLHEKKNLFGAGGMADRSKALHLTRTMTKAFKRVGGGDYDGSKTEWDAGRKQRVINQHRQSRGLEALPDAAFETIDEPEKSDRSARRVSFNRYKEIDPRMADTARPVAKISRFTNPIVAYDEEDSAEEGEIREVATLAVG